MGIRNTFLKDREVLQKWDPLSWRLLELGISNPGLNGTIKMEYFIQQTYE